MIRIIRIPPRMLCDVIDENSNVIDPKNKFTTTAAPKAAKYTQMVCRNSVPETPASNVNATININQGM